MTLEESIDKELLALRLIPLNADQVKCLNDPAQLEDAAGMLEDLQDRCGVRLPATLAQIGRQVRQRRLDFLLDHHIDGALAFIDRIERAAG